MHSCNVARGVIMPEFESIDEAIEYLIEEYGDLSPDDYIEVDIDISGDT